MPWHGGKPVEAARLRARAALLCVLLLAGAALSACTLPAGDAPAPGPDLRQVTLPARTAAAQPESTAQTGGEDYALVDFWLDGTQNMGGISTIANSMFPHTGRKYREGGFHYHYGANAGWYESLLGDFLTAAGDARVRTLRYGNELFPDNALAAYGLLPGGAAARASIWRDLHTVAQETDSGFFKQMSTEDMSRSFYALGARAWLTRMAAFDPLLLENPALQAAMAEAQAARADAVATRDDTYVIQAGRGEENCALYTALPNLDLRRLNVITVDPASVRRITGADESGKAIAYYQQLLSAMGVFDAGLCVAVLDFQLDYLGQMATFSTADFSEPLVWGRVILDERKQTFLNLGVMPRRMLTLVVGTRARVDGFIDSLGRAIAADRGLRGLRGPQNGELLYAAGGQTVAQQPFTFAWNHTVIERPDMGLYTQDTQGALLTAEPAAALDTALSGLPLLRLATDDKSAQPDRTLTIRLPIRRTADGATLDVSRLNSATLTAECTVLLDRVVPNSPALSPPVAGEQAVRYRDQVYVFAAGADASAFTLEGIALQNDTLVLTLRVTGSLLKTGYYRLRVAADATAEQVAWAQVPWIDSEDSVSVSISDAQVYEWEIFTVAMTEYDRETRGLPRMFQHAWGGFTDKLYHGLRVPEFPPVYRSLRLAELAAQLRGAAAAHVSPLIRYTFEVFVPSP